MKIEYKDIILRDMTEADIEDDIRWYTVETDWSNWDAPWEPLPDISDADAYRKKELSQIEIPTARKALSPGLISFTEIHSKFSLII